jgi:hypothetical protein
MGGCNCSKGGPQTDLIQARTSYPTAAGNYPLATYPDCTELYPGNGPFAGNSIYAVARGTLQERLFARTDLAAASEYMKSVRGADIENIPTSGLCAAAVIAVYG